MKSLALPAALLAASLAGPALAQDPPDRADRLTALEARLEALEAETAEAKRELAAARAEIATLKSQAAAPATAASEDAPEAETPATDAEALAGDDTAPADTSTDSGADSGASSPNAFNPAISLVLDGQVASHSLDPDAYVRAGFPLVGEGGPSPQGLSLGESEITLSANVDDKFYGQLSVALESEDGEDAVGVEEAFIDTTALPHGLQLRVGRTFSNIGYFNSHHAHTDKFADRPLAYQALLGNQYGDDGVQLRWVAPTDLFVELGGEVFRGERFPAGGAGRGGTGTRTLFAHLGGDVGDESSWLAGLSALDARTEGGEDGFTGRHRLYVADATWKWAPEGNFKDGGVTLRGEYLVEHRDGDFVDPADPSLDGPWDGRRAGAYIEAVYRLNRRWETGYRYDRLWADDDGPYASGFDPTRHSIMVAWMNSEFSLLRLQYAHDRPNPVDTDDVLTLQYQMNLGAHGAHKF